MPGFIDLNYEDLLMSLGIGRHMLLDLWCMWAFICEWKLVQVEALDSIPYKKKNKYDIG